MSSKEKHPQIIKIVAMMTNKELAGKFQLLAKLMELHGESSYRIKSYSNAYRILRAESEDVAPKPLEEIKGIKGIGDAIGKKIIELAKDGKMSAIEEYKKITPRGIIELMGIKGLGIKKIKLLWSDLQITSPGELLYACNENRLVSIKGFGPKTQSNIKEQLEYYFQSIDKFHYATLEEEADNLIDDIQEVLEDTPISLTGSIRRLMPVLEHIEILIGQRDITTLFDKKVLTLVEQREGVYYCKSIDQQFPVKIYTCPKTYFAYYLLLTTGPEKMCKELFEVLMQSPIELSTSAPKAVEDWTEAEFFESAELPFIPAEIRDVPKILYRIKARGAIDLVKQEDIKGVVHAHSTWSDGSNTIKEMAEAARDAGYQYLGLTDHSQAAFYANGLKPDRVLAQMEEIDELNKELAPFKIFKGIEADILYDGQLDYDDELLAKFDFVIASVHSNLRMDKEKATQRILRAVRNPYTTILGHPTGRILLSRQGYPIDHEAIIDACAKHGVAIELNANPLRMDIDYTWIPYALEQGVKIAINPDAHHIDGIEDIRYGVLTARKGLVTQKDSLNSLTMEEFRAYISQKVKG